MSRAFPARSAALCILALAALPASASAAAAGWSVVHSPNAPTHHGTLASVSCTAANACVAVGAYVDSAGKRVPLVETWGGSAWALRSTPAIRGQQASFAGVSCVGATFCAAVGSFTDPQGAQRTLAELWNGTTWSVEPSPNPSGVYIALSGVSCASATSCTAVGGYQASPSYTQTAFVEQWNGATWSVAVTPPPPSGGGNALAGVSCTTATACTAVGWSADASFQQSTLAERWNGTAWTTEPTANPNSQTVSLSGISCPSVTACTAVGSFNDSSSGTTHSLAEQWDGAVWTIKPSPGPAGASNTSFSSVNCSGVAACIAVGLSDQTALTEGWDGSTWVTQSAYIPPGAQYSPLASVACFASSACMAVGVYTSATNALPPLAEQWNGSVWRSASILSPHGTAGSALSGVSCVSATACIAVGAAFSDAGLPKPLSEIWNGTTWAIRSAPAPAGATTGTLSAVTCTSVTACIAVGSYSDATGAQLTLADRWDGSTWVVIPTANPSGAIGSSLLAVACTSTTSCIGVGESSSSTGQATLAEQWDGTTWTIQSTPNQAGTTVDVLAGVACPTVNVCEAVGNAVNRATIPPQAALAEGWNGTSWTIQATPTVAGSSSLGSIACPVSGLCVAVGGQSNGNASLAETWNGSSWTVQSTPNPAGAVNSTLLGVFCSAASSCSAVGTSAGANPSPSHALGEEWNGTAWVIQLTPDLSGAETNQLVAVSCPLATFCAAAGGAGKSFGDGSGNGTTVTLIERYSG